MSHIFCYAQLVSVCFTLKRCFLLYNALSTNVTVVSDKDGSFFFIVTLVYSGYIAFPYIMHCIHLSHFFLLHQKFLSPIFSCAQLVSVYFTLKLCFLLYNALSTNVTIISDKEGVILFSSSHLYVMHSLSQSVSH